MVGGSAQHEELAVLKPNATALQRLEPLPSQKADNRTHCFPASRWLPGTTLGISDAKMSKARASGSAELRLSTWSHVPDKTTGEPNIRTAGATEAYKTVAANCEVSNSLPY